MITHGTASGYGYHKCRCDKCRAYKADEARRLRESRRRERLSAPHPFISGSKCQCESCCAARAAATKDRERRYYRENRESKLEYRRNRYADQDYAESARAYARTYRQNTPDRRRGDREYAEAQRLKSAIRRARKAKSPTIRYTTAQLAAKWAYWGNRCYLRIPGICTGDAEHVEHVKPLRAGGANMLANLRPSCGPCNSSKGGRWPFSIAYHPLVEDMAAAT